jgi:TolA-binding protein
MPVDFTTQAKEKKTMNRWWLTPMMLLLAGLVHAQDFVDLRIEAQWEQAQKLYRHTRYAKAAVVFQRLADQLPELDPLAEESRYKQGECLRLLHRDADAAKAYSQALLDYPFGSLRSYSIHRLYDIANSWLDDTRAEMREMRELYQGKRLIVWPAAYNWTPGKPFLTQELAALRLLELVHYSDPTNPLAEKGLFLVGCIHFFREEYTSADRSFSMILKEYPDGTLFPQALELAVMSKSLTLETCPDPKTKAKEIITLAEKGLKDVPHCSKDRLQRYSLAAIQIDKGQGPTPAMRRQGQKGESSWPFLIRLMPQVDPLESIAENLLGNMVEAVDFVLGALGEDLSEKLREELSEESEPRK